MTSYRIYVAILCSIFAVTLVRGNPVIIEPEKQPVFAQDGLSFSLVCEYKDPNDIGVQWYLDNQKIDAKSDSNFDILNEKVDDAEHRYIVKSILTKNGVNKDDEGNYYCRPKNGGTGTGFSTRVNVVNVIAENDTLEIGKNAVLKCSIQGGIYSQITFKWYRIEDPNTELKDGEKYAIDQKNGTLTIKNAEASDAGQYLCKYTMNSGFVLERTLSLNAAPVVKNFESKSKNLVQGDPLTVNCEVYSEPKPTISWLKDGQELDTADPRVTLKEHDGLANATLRIEDLDFEDRAEYMCLASNEFGSGNNTVMVRVKENQVIKAESELPKLEHKTGNGTSNSTKEPNKLAALWPFLGICAEVVILCTIIFIYEKRRAKKMEEEEMPEEAGHFEETRTRPTPTTTKEKMKSGSGSDKEPTLPVSPML